MTAVDPPRAGSTRHLVWLYHDASLRDGIAALFALEREIVASARPELDHAVTHARLDWWQQETQRLAAGQPAHPLAARLLAALRARSAPAPDFEPLVEVCRWAVAGTAFEDRAELEQCFDGWARTVFATAARLAVPDAGAATRQFVVTAGRALREVGALANLARDAVHGRVHLPMAELDALGIDHLAVTRLPWDERLATGIRARLDHCAQQLQTASASSSAADRAALRGLQVWCALGRRRAERAAADLPFQYAARRTDGIADAWRAWRAARASQV